MSTHYPSKWSLDASQPNTLFRVQSSCASHSYQSKMEWIGHAQLHPKLLSWSPFHWIAKRPLIPLLAPWSSNRSISRQHQDYLTLLLSTIYKEIIHDNFKLTRSCLILRFWSSISYCSILTFAATISSRRLACDSSIALVLLGYFTGFSEAVEGLLGGRVANLSIFGAASLTKSRFRGLYLVFWKFGDLGLVTAICDLRLFNFSSNLRCIYLNISPVTVSPIFGLKGYNSEIGSFLGGSLCLRSKSFCIRLGIDDFANEISACSWILFLRSYSS